MQTSAMTSRAQPACVSARAVAPVRVRCSPFCLPARRDPCARFGGIPRYARSPSGQHSALLTRILPQTKFARRSGACAAVKDDIMTKIEFVAGGDKNKPTPFDLYQGTAYSVREKLFDSFNKTHKYWECVSRALRDQPAPFSDLT